MVDGAYTIEGLQIGFRCTNEDYGLLLDDALAEYRSEQTAPAFYGLVIGEDSGSKRHQHFNILYRAVTAVIRTLDLRTFSWGVLSEIEANLFDSRDDAMYLNASMIASRNKVGIGPVNMTWYLDRMGRRVEKSGLALWPARYVAVDYNTGQIIPSVPRLDIPEEFWKEIDRMSPQDGSDHRYQVFIDGPRDLDAAFGYGDGDLLHPVSKAFLVYRFATNLVNLPKLGMTGLRGLARMVEPARRFGVYAPEGRQLLQAVSTAMGEGRVPVAQ